MREWFWLIFTEERRWRNLWAGSYRFRDTLESQVKAWGYGIASVPAQSDLGREKSDGREFQFSSNWSQINLPLGGCKIESTLLSFRCTSPFANTWGALKFCKRWEGQFRCRSSWFQDLSRGQFYSQFFSREKNNLRVSSPTLAPLSCSQKLLKEVAETKCYLKVQKAPVGWLGGSPIGVL